MAPLYRLLVPLSIGRWYYPRRGSASTSTSRGHTDGLRRVQSNGNVTEAKLFVDRQHYHLSELYVFRNIVRQ